MTHLHHVSETRSVRNGYATCWCGVRIPNGPPYWQDPEPGPNDRFPIAVLLTLAAVGAAVTIWLATAAH